MTILLLLASVILFSVWNIEGVKTVQERARVVYYDTNYVKDAMAFTSRRGRMDSYRSNFTGTILHPWGNNVTVYFEVKRSTNADLNIAIKLCDIAKHKWMVDVLQNLMNLKPMCPYPAGSYAAYDVELPPKDYPFPIPKGAATLSAYFLLTDTNNLLLKFQMKVKTIQERARVLYYDTNYVKDAKAFTFRRGRRDSYRSNFTCTVLHPWGNNITADFDVKGHKNTLLNDLHIGIKLCDVTKHKWTVEVIQNTMNIKPMCPYPAGPYTAYDVELPPKGFPFPVPKGEATLSASFLLTDTNKLLLKFQMKVITV